MKRKTFAQFILAGGAVMLIGAVLPPPFGLVLLVGGAVFLIIVNAIVILRW